MWTGKKPTQDTPPGATYAFNRAQVLKECVVKGIVVAEDTLNPGEFVIQLFLVSPVTRKQFVISAWRDEERNGAGWLDIEAIDRPTSFGSIDE